MVYLFLAEGFEIIEALAPVDMLKRAKIDVKTVGVTGKTVKSSANICVTADITVDEIDLDENLEAVILPGGMPGTLNLENSQKVQEAIDFATVNELLICAICAAPSILGHKDLLMDKYATAFPGFEKDLTGAKASDEYVVTDGNIITAKGAGVSIDFGLEIVRYLRGDNVQEEIRKTIQCK